jgi:hypothetical protein
MEELRTEMLKMCQDLTHQLVQTIQATRQSAQQELEQQEQQHLEEPPEEEPLWASILEDLPASPSNCGSLMPKNLQIGQRTQTPPR